MASYMIRGGNRLVGDVTISGSKNAALGIIAASMLLDGPCKIDHAPNVDDINMLVEICRSMGAQIRREADGALEIDPRFVTNGETIDERSRNIRGSYYLLGAMLGRFNYASIYMPGGCNFGPRPIDLHVKGFEALGATTVFEHGRITVSSEKMQGEHIFLDTVSVGATINIMIAAAKIEGVTVIENAAREPEITNLAQALRSMGAIISGEGTGTIHVKGDTALHGATVRTIADRIEACTYLLAGIITGGEVVVEDVAPEHLEAFFAKLEEAGAEAWASGGDARARRSARLSSLSLKALPYPGFPTDLQPQMMAVLALADGTSIVQDGVFESRFLHVNELQKMGARIDVQGGTAVITGVPHLRGADVRATDLRAGAALILAGLAASEETAVFQIQHINRGYENIVSKLRSLGAAIDLDSSEEEDLA